MNVWVFTIIISCFFPFIKENYGIEWCFIIFLVTSIIGEIFVIITIKETKGNSLNEIWKELGVKLNELDVRVQSINNDSHED